MKLRQSRREGDSDSAAWGRADVQWGENTDANKASLKQILLRTETRT